MKDIIKVHFLNLKFKYLDLENRYKILYNNFTLIYDQLMVSQDQSFKKDIEIITLKDDISFLVRENIKLKEELFSLKNNN